MTVSLHRLGIVTVAVVGAALAGCQGGLPSPGSDANTGQALLDVADGMVTLREENAMMQAQIDSLRGVVAYQDSVVRQLAAIAGVAMRPQAMVIPQ